MLHYGEEPILSGCFGTGAVFFSGCTLRCVYCQNAAISADGYGRELSPSRLRTIFETLLDEGAQSIDLVTPTQFLPSILPALTPKLPVPVIYNCGGYESVETLKQLEGLVDIYLPDMKYADNALAARLSKAPDYFEIATAAISEMYRQVGGAVLADDMLQRGLVVRHLVLPGCLENTLRVLEWFAETFPGRDVFFSLMSQYIPVGKQQPPFDRRLTHTEYEGALSWLELCGIQNGFTQDFSAATAEYLPLFDGSGI